MATSKRQHSARKATPELAATPAAPVPPPDPRDAVINALAVDPGPLAITITGNLVTKRVQVLDNASSESDLQTLMAWMESARGYLQNKLLAAAEARGRAAAAQPPGG